MKQVATLALSTAIISAFAPLSAPAQERGGRGGLGLPPALDHRVGMFAHCLECGDRGWLTRDEFFGAYPDEAFEND